MFDVFPLRALSPCGAVSDRYASEDLFEDEASSLREVVMAQRPTATYVLFLFQFIQFVHSPRIVH
jgi:hypothetical protein